jgi:glutaconate CoA-transferase subunit B
VTDEMMTAATARELKDGAVSFVDLGWPTEATNPARATHVPDCVLIYESGTLGAKPTGLPLFIGDGVLARRQKTEIKMRGEVRAAAGPAKLGSWARQPSKP